MIWLADKLKQQGVVFQKIHLNPVSEIVKLVPDLQAIFNCSNGSFHLADAEDKLYKVEHQYIAYVRAPWIDKSRTLRGANGRKLFPMQTFEGLAMSYRVDAIHQAQEWAGCVARGRRASPQDRSRNMSSFA